MRTNQPRALPYIRLIGAAFFIVAAIYWALTGAWMPALVSLPLIGYFGYRGMIDLRRARIEASDGVDRH